MNYKETTTRRVRLEYLITNQSGISGMVYVCVCMCVCVREGLLHIV